MIHLFKTYMQIAFGKTPGWLRFLGRWSWCFLVTWHTWNLVDTGGHGYRKYECGHCGRTKYEGGYTGY